MRRILLILFTTLSLSCFAGLPNPFDWGDKVSAPLFNRHLSPISATISLTPDSNFRKCLFDITYEVESDTSQIEIPLLLFINGIPGETINFWVDGKLIDRVSSIPESTKYIKGTEFGDFGTYFSDEDEDQLDTSAKEPDNTTLHWFHHFRHKKYYLNNFYYINAIIGKGRHTIEINYIGSKWTYLLDIAKSYSYRYSLTPALKWRPVIPIKVIVDNRALQGDYSLNIGTLVSKNPDTYLINRLDKLEDDFLALNWQPKMNPYASALIYIDPTRTTWWIGILLFAFTFYCHYKFRQRNNPMLWMRIYQLTTIFLPFIYITIRLIRFLFENHSQEQTLSMSIILIGLVGCWGVWNEAKDCGAIKPMHLTFIISSLAIAFIIPHMYITLYELIYWLIGPAAGKWARERLVAYVLAVPLFSIYLTILYVVDWRYRRKVNNETLAGK